MESYSTPSNDIMNGTMLPEHVTSTDINDYGADVVWVLPAYIVIMTNVSIAIQITLLIVIFFGNSLVVILVAKNEQLWTMSNFFVVSLAFADVLVSLSMIPGVYLTLNPTFANGVYTCLLVWCPIIFSTSISCLSLTMITLDRYIKVAHPYVYHSVGTERSVLIAIVSVWIYSILIAMVLPFAGIHSLVPGQVFCFEFGAVFDVIHLHFFLIANGIIPFIIMIVLYFHLFIIVLQKIKSDRRIMPQVGHQQANRPRSELKSIKTLVIILGFTCIAWIPSNALVFIDLYTPQYAPGLVPRTILSWLTYLNSAVNPFIYALRSETFRVAAKRAFSITTETSLVWWINSVRGNPSRVHPQSGNNTAQSNGREDIRDGSGSGDDTSGFPSSMAVELPDNSNRLDILP
ncbi:adenosine receptor A1-like [Lytechinus pictus]|uniref:adenosine receptor A1-like n=1 Tax=Lytechinus pictus TaxID=7653 RepID=UPI0030B9BF26